MESTKVCPKCKETKSVENFYNTLKSKIKWCRPCKRKKDKEYSLKTGVAEKLKQKRLRNIINVRKAEKAWRDANPEYAKGKLLQKYWPDDTWTEALKRFRALLAKQNYVCAICKQPETSTYRRGPNPNKVRDLCVDHCHATGKVRGLLCDYCNVMIARARDNPEICRSGADYLEKNK